jgi:hypothetical protein
MTTGKRVFELWAEQLGKLSSEAATDLITVLCAENSKLIVERDALREVLREYVERFPKDGAWFNAGDIAREDRARALLEGK